MNTDDLTFGLAFFALAVLLLVGVFGLVYWVHAAHCERTWAKSGMRSDYALIQGCLVQRKDGTWVPASAIRDIQP